jgi:class I fructose-bisphosphate aldolase
MRATFGKLGAADGILIAPGSLSHVEEVFVGRHRPGLLLQMDWTSWARQIYAPREDGRTEGVSVSLASMEEAAAAGADGVMSYLFVGQLDSGLEREDFERNAKLARACDRLGMVLVIEPRSAREGLEESATGAEVLSFCCRVAAELGADIVKCVWPGSIDALAEITSSCTSPVVLAGGPGGDEDASTYELARAAIDAGAAGLMFGRRVYSSRNPEVVVQNLLRIVHEDESVEGLTGGQERPLGSRS